MKKVTTVIASSSEVSVKILVLKDDGTSALSHIVSLPFDLIPDKMCHEIAGAIAQVNGYLNLSEDGKI